MTRRIDEHVHVVTSVEQYDRRHRVWPRSLAEWDVEDARSERLREQAALRAANRSRP